MQEDHVDTWRRIYFPHLHRRRTELINGAFRLAHYTSGAVASSVLSRKEVWMRNASTMNDFREVEYGIGLLTDAWNRRPGKILQDAIESIQPGMVSTVAPLFDSWRLLLRQHTYLTCVSEHDDSEDTLGRLSMWRAYGGDCGVALILSRSIWQIASDALRGMFSLPVLYADQAQFDRYLDEIATNIAANKEFIVRGGPDGFRNALFEMLRSMAISTKHPGFSEEREWRVTYSPHLGPSRVIRVSTEVVRDTPQLVFKIPLEGIEPDLAGLAIPNLIESVLVGPTMYPHAVADGIKYLLETAGIQNAASRVRVSEIPLRHW